MLKFKKKREYLSFDNYAMNNKKKKKNNCTDINNESITQTTMNE